MTRSAIFVDRNSAIPLYRQVESAFREAILSGRLAPGERVLSSRELQTHLGVSRNTVLGALEQLHAEGYLVTIRGVGTFVAATMAQLPLGRERSARAVIPHSTAPAGGDAVAFRPGLPALDLFPLAQFRRGFKAANWTRATLRYGDDLGYRPLREAIAQRLQQTRGIACSPDHLLIASGAQAAFALIVSVLAKPRDVAIVEDPGYRNFHDILIAHGVHAVGAPVDDAGIDVSTFQRRRARFVYVTPSHQYPTGAVLTLERRLALLDWAERHDSWIIEDDYDSEFNYTDHPYPALQGLGDGRRVIYVGTFSKALAPAVRVAYIIVPPSLIPAFKRAQAIASAAPSTIDQCAVTSFINEGYLGRHIARMRAVYDERRRYAGAELTALGGGTFRVRDHRAGLHFIAELPAEIDDVAFSRKAGKRGIYVPALSRYYYGTPQRNGIVVGYAATPMPEAHAAIELLAAALDEVTSST